jgi:hypothetical protein
MHSPSLVCPVCRSSGPSPAREELTHVRPRGNAPGGCSQIGYCLRRPAPPPPLARRGATASITLSGPRRSPSLPLTYLPLCSFDMLFAPLLYRSPRRTEERDGEQPTTNIRPRYRRHQPSREKGRRASVVWCRPAAVVVKRCAARLNYSRSLLDRV